MDKRTTGGSADSIPADLTFEAALKELEAIVVRLERGELTLDDSIRQYERGEALKRHCAALLDRAEQRIERIRVGEGGEAVGVAPLDPE